MPYYIVAKISGKIPPEISVWLNISNKVVAGTVAAEDLKSFKSKVDDFQVAKWLKKYIK